jgi:hypothetical protein
VQKSLENRTLSFDLAHEWDYTTFIIRQILIFDLLVSILKIIGFGSSILDSGKRGTVALKRNGFCHRSKIEDRRGLVGSWVCGVRSLLLFPCVPVCKYSAKKKRKKNKRIGALSIIYNDKSQVVFS